MISENDVILIVKSYIRKILGSSRLQNDSEFISSITQNAHIDKVLFSKQDANSILPHKKTQYLEAYRSFCVTFDCIPNDDDWLDLNAFTLSLHNKYKYILDNCQLQGQNLTDIENVELNRANEFLFNNDFSPSQVYLNYIQLKEEIISLKDQLAADQMAANSMAETELQTWKKNGRKFLKNKIEVVEQKLAVEGQQHKVELSIQILNNSHKKDPAIIVESLKEKISELEKMYGIGMTTVSTSYLPVLPSPQFHNIGIWHQVTIPKKEIQQILEQFRKVGKSLNIDNNLTQIDFNWSQVYLSRNWFDSTFFDSKFWTLPDNTKVSEGKRPNSGILPTYVKQIIFTNGISYKAQTSTQPKRAPRPNQKIRRKKQPQSVTTLPVSSINMMSFAQVNHIQKPKPSFNTGHAKRKNKPTKIPTKRFTTQTAMLAPKNLNVFVTAKPATRNKAVARKSRQQFTAQKFTLANQKAVEKMILENDKQALKQKQQIFLQAYLTQRNVSFIAPTSTIKVQTREIDIKNPLVLAFACKRVPLCPASVDK